MNPTHWKKIVTEEKWSRWDVASEAGTYCPTCKAAIHFCKMSFTKGSVVAPACACGSLGPCRLICQMMIWDGQPGRDIINKRNCYLFIFDPNSWIIFCMIWLVYMRTKLGFCRQSFLNPFENAINICNYSYSALDPACECHQAKQNESKNFLSGSLPLLWLQRQEMKWKISHLHQATKSPPQCSVCASSNNFHLLINVFNI